MGWITAIVIIMSTIISTGTVCFYHRYFTERIVVLDLEFYMQEQEVRFLEGEIDEAELKRRLAAVKTAVDKMSRNNIILSKEAVIAGGSEIQGELLHVEIK